MYLPSWVLTHASPWYLPGIEGSWVVHGPRLGHHWISRSSLYLQLDGQRVPLGLSAQDITGHPRVALGLLCMVLVHGSPMGLRLLCLEDPWVAHGSSADIYLVYRFAVDRAWFSTRLSPRKLQVHPKDYL